MTTEHRNIYTARSELYCASVLAGGASEGIARAWRQLHGVHRERVGALVGQLDELIEAIQLAYQPLADEIEMAERAEGVWR